VKQADRRGFRDALIPEIRFPPTRSSASKARLEQPRQDDTGPSIGGYGGDMSTPHKSLKYKAITLTA
jgi:hypothetical protein